MFEIVLTAEQEAEAERIEDVLKAKAAVEIKHIAPPQHFRLRLCSIARCPLLI